MADAAGPASVDSHAIVSREAELAYTIDVPCYKGQTPIVDAVTMVDGTLRVMFVFSSMILIYSGTNQFSKRVIRFGGGVDDGRVSSASLSSDGQTAVVMSEYNKITICDTATGNLLKTIHDNVFGHFPTSHVAVTNNLGYVITHRTDLPDDVNIQATVRVLELDCTAHDGLERSYQIKQSVGYNPYIDDKCAVSPDDTFLIMRVSRTQITRVSLTQSTFLDVQVWDLPICLAGDVNDGRAVRNSSLIISACGKYVIASNFDEPFYVFSSSSGEVLRSIPFALNSDNQARLSRLHLSASNDLRFIGVGVYLNGHGYVQDVQTGSLVNLPRNRTDERLVAAALDKVNNRQMLLVHRAFMHRSSRISVFTICKWSDKTHCCFPVEFRTLIFELMCIKTRLESTTACQRRKRPRFAEPLPLPHLAMELWLHIFLHLYYCGRPWHDPTVENARAQSDSKKKRAAPIFKDDLPDADLQLEYENSESSSEFEPPDTEDLSSSSSYIDNEDTDEEV